MFIDNLIPYLSSPQQLQDPRGGRNLDVSHTTHATDQSHIQRREPHSIPRQSTPDSETMQNENHEPPRCSFAYTPSQQKGSKHFDVRRHSFASFEHDFISNLFYVTFGTLESANTYLQNLCSFGFPSFSHQATTSSSTPYISKFRTDRSYQTTNFNLNKTFQQDEPLVDYQEQQREPDNAVNFLHVTGIISQHLGE